MSHVCEDCGEEFETLSSFRLHDCAPSEGRTAQGGTTPQIEVEKLEDLLGVVRDGENEALYRALAAYEKALASAHESGETDRYREMSRTYREPLAEALDEATVSEGWRFLDGFLEAYNPEDSEEIPHATPVLQNVTGRHTVRTRLTDSVDAVPADALSYFEAVHADIGEDHDLIREGLHPYGWGIGHPKVDVADSIHAEASENVFLAGAMLEHAFYADQHAAVDLLEKIVEDGSVRRTVPDPRGDITGVRVLLDAPAAAASDFRPTVPRYWDWQEEFGHRFELEEGVEEGVRRIVEEEGLDEDLPDGWEVADLTL